MTIDTAPWTTTLALGDRRVFGFLQVDIAHHSSLAGSNADIQRMRGNLHRSVSSTLALFDAHELHWAGDGGAYLFLLDHGVPPDGMIIGALQVLDNMRMFNTMRQLNPLDDPIRIRVSCHIGDAMWDPDLSNLYGKSINYFLKAEREIGSEDRLALTEEAFHEISDSDLRRLFFSHATHNEYRLDGTVYTRAIYLSMPIDTVAREDYRLENGSPPSVAEVARHLRTAQRIDLLLAGGDSFVRVFYDALQHVGDDRAHDLSIRVLLRRSSSASPRSETQFLSLAERDGIDVSVRFYDTDFMLRGYGFDDSLYLSYFLREGNVLTGRYNPMVRVQQMRSSHEAFLHTMFSKTFNAYFENPLVGAEPHRPLVEE